MADHDEARLVVELEETGEQIDNTTSFDIQSSFITQADAWSFTVANEDKPWELRRKFYPGRPVKLYLGDRLQVIGRIGNIRGSGGASGSLRVSGRDYFADLIDPVVDPSVRITNLMTLKDALLEGLRVLGITEIESSVEEVTAKKMGPVNFRTERTKAVPTEEFDRAQEPDAAAFLAAIPDLVRNVPITEPVRESNPLKGGEGALQWASRLASRYHLSVQPGTKRSSIALVAPDYVSDVRFNFARPGNIETATCERNGEDVPSFVNASGRLVDEEQLAKGGFSGISVTDESAGFVTSNEGRKFVEASRMVKGRLKRSETNELPALYKPLYFNDDRSKSANELKSATNRMLANKLRGFFTYTAQVNAHIDVATGATYATNTLADVQDSVEDVSERLWIVETNLSKGGGMGKRASVKMILPGTYLL